MKKEHAEVITFCIKWWIQYIDESEEFEYLLFEYLENELKDPFEVLNWDRIKRFQKTLLGYMVNKNSSKT